MRSEGGEGRGRAAGGRGPLGDGLDPGASLSWVGLPTTRVPVDLRGLNHSLQSG